MMGGGGGGWCSDPFNSEFGENKDRMTKLDKLKRSYKIKMYQVRYLLSTYWTDTFIRRTGSRSRNTIHS